MSAQGPAVDARRRGFSLLEMMAVVLMIGLLLAVAVPNLGVTRTAKLRSETRQLAAVLEYARQRAVMTRQTHRLLLGLDEGWYQLDWYVNDSREQGLSAIAPARETTLHANSPIDMAPSQLNQASYRPVPGKQGDVDYLDEEVHFAGAQTAEGRYESGEFQLVFYSDGSTDAVELVLRIDDEPGFVLQVSPLIDLVRILDEED
jgi:prepilin-type N-terminal cleavage/methylation domain-containing protein